MFGEQARVVSGKPDNPVPHPLETLSQGTGRMTAQAGDTLESVASQKALLRRRLRQRRAALPGALRARAAHAACRRLLRLASLRRARHVGVYLEAGSELSAAPLRARLAAFGVGIHVPVIGSPGRLRYAPWRPDAPLRHNHHRIAEPAARRMRTPWRRLDVLIVPLVGFDTYGHRLGAGGGYYDRLLARARPFGRPRLIGLAFECQFVERLPVEPWDVGLDLVVTERAIRPALPVAPQAESS